MKDVSFKRGTVRRWAPSCKKKTEGNGWLQNVNTITAIYF